MVLAHAKLLCVLASSWSDIGVHSGYVLKNLDIFWNACVRRAFEWCLLTQSFCVFCILDSNWRGTGKCPGVRPGVPAYAGLLCSACSRRAFVCSDFD